MRHNEPIRGTAGIAGNGAYPSAGYDGGHRLARIEDTLRLMDTKMDQLVETAAVSRTEIAWLKWSIRVLFAAVLGVGGVAAQAVL